MAADVEKRPRPSVWPAHDHEAVGTDLPHEVVAGFGDPGRVPRADPPTEDPLQLPLEHARIGEGPRGKHRGPLQRLERGPHVTPIQLERRLRLACQARPPSGIKLGSLTL